MTVIITHQADELKLLDLQHKILETLNKSCVLHNSVCFYETIPLWFKTNLNLSNKQEIKKISKSIKQLTVTSISFYNDEVLLTASLLLNNETTELCTLPILKVYRSKKNQNNDEKLDIEKINAEIKKIAESFIPLSLKIFRLGSALESNNSITLQDDVWVKLK